MSLSSRSARQQSETALTLRRVQFGCSRCRCRIYLDSNFAYVDSLGNRLAHAAAKRQRGLDYLSHRGEDGFKILNRGDNR